MFERHQVFGPRHSEVVRYQDLLVPVEALLQFTTRFVEPFLIINCGVHELLGDYALSRRGTATKIRYRSEPILLTTSHQLKGNEAAHVCIFDKSARTVTTASQHWSFGFNSDETDSRRRDVEAFSFSGAERDGKINSQDFFRLPEARLGFTTREIVGVIITGYPEESQSWREESDDIRFRPEVVWAEFIGPGPADYLSCRAVEPITFSPNGMSGSAVFFLVGGSSGFGLELAGILATASREVFNFVPLTFPISLITNLAITGPDQIRSITPINSATEPAPARGMAPLTDPLRA